MSGLYSYKGKLYPDYLKSGNAMRFIEPVAREFCKGYGIDIGSGNNPLPGAIDWDLNDGLSAYNIAIPDVDEKYSYIFSSHCLEHLKDPIGVLEYWKTMLRGVLFLYLPHPDMEYWLPQNNRKHLHSWYPEDMEKILVDIGYQDVLVSERDMAWSFAAVGYVRQ